MKSLITATAFAALGACGSLNAKDPNVQPYALVEKTPPIEVHWTGAKSCFGKACAQTFIDKCVIEATPPDSWNDSERLQALGHELLHCLGHHHAEAWRK